MTIAAERPAATADTLKTLREMLAAVRASLVSPELPATEVIVLDPALLTADDAAAAVLEQLSRKVEVGRRLRAAYIDGFGKPVDDRPVRVDVSTYLACLFMFVGLARGDWKFLNTAMKMQDGILVDKPITLPAAFESALRVSLGEAA
ncbi:hypothetical protein [Bosea sp. UC22_33]|uniref:hypothetical protein n=1 Tax=Bosea sp. UC22_33 TaxID=3350165 RepID=UPI0036713D10